MVKYVAWCTRVVGEPLSEQQDEVVRLSAAEQGVHDIPSAWPGWARDKGWGTDYGHEQFPGARPVWVWEA